MEEDENEDFGATYDEERDDESLHSTGSPTMPSHRVSPSHVA